MKTLPNRSQFLSVAAAIGLLLSVAHCGSGANDAVSAAQGASQNHPPRPTTKEACDLCQGLWAAHGIELEETCICKTTDDGHECVDGNDCEGECLLEGDAEFHVMDQSDPPRGYYKGHCAAYDTTFGCFRHIPNDIQSELPLASEEASESICVD